MNGGTAVTTGEHPVVRPPDAAQEEAPRPVPPTIFFAISPVDTKVSWSSDTTLVHMLTDLVKASGGAVSTDADGILAATTGTALEALVVGVRAVRLATSYARYRPAGIQAFSVAIVAAPERGGNPEIAVRQMLTESLDAWRILLAGEALHQLRTVPGLQAKKLPALPGQRVDVHELILPAITPETQTGEVVAVGANQPPAIAAKPASPTRGMPVLVPRAVEVEEERPSSGLSRKLLIGGLAAALIVGGIALKVIGARAPAAPAVTAPATTTPATTTPATTTPATDTPAATTPAATPPVSVPAVVRSKPVAAPAADGPAVRAPREAAAAKGKGKGANDDQPQAATRAESDSPHGGFTAEQLRAILDKADKLTANGKYEEAIRNYNVVLAAEPGNGRAKAGKERAVTNMNMP